MIQFKHIICTFPLAVAIAVSGCIYRPDIQQGNELTDAMIASLTMGMSKDEVADVFGRPLVTDPFNRDRWDYYYFHKDGETGAITERALSITFVNNKVTEFTSTVPEPTLEPEADDESEADDDAAADDSEESDSVAE